MSSPTDVLREATALAVLLLFGLSGAAEADGAAGHEEEGPLWSAPPAFAVPTPAGDAVNPITTPEGDPGDHESNAVIGEVETPGEFAGIVGRYVAFPAPVPTDYLRTIRMFEPGHRDTAEGLQPAAPPPTISGSSSPTEETRITIGAGSNDGVARAA